MIGGTQERPVTGATGCQRVMTHTPLYQYPPLFLKLQLLHLLQGNER